MARASRKRPQAGPGKGRTLYAADWVVPASSPPIAEGAVLVDGAQVVEVGPASKLKREGFDAFLELSGHLLMPGLVNAHTHLELSFLKGRLAPGSPFDKWIEALVAEIFGAEKADFEEAVRSGLAESVGNGITALGDISRTGLSYPLLREAGLKGTVFLELLGFHPLMEADALGGLRKALGEHAPEPGGGRLLGLTPHAPYSTSEALYREAARLARGSGLPLAVHVAETAEEELFVRSGEGPLRELLERFGLWHEGFSTPGVSPVAYLEALGVLGGALAVHCNTADDDDIARLKAAGARVVLCPLSNAWFGRPARHPLPKLLEAGVPCCLGTDSLASNTGLDLLAEMGLCAKAHPELPADEVFRLATTAAAEALGLGGLCGSLEAGKAADLVALRTPAGGLREPLEWVVGEAVGQDVAFVAVDGTVVLPLAPG